MLQYNGNPTSLGDKVLKKRGKIAYAIIQNNQQQANFFNTNYKRES